MAKRRSRRTKASAHRICNAQLGKGKKAKKERCVMKVKKSLRRRRRK